MTRTRGFSLVELLVVIGIIGLLVAIIIPNLNGAKSASRDARRISDIKNIQLSLTLYYNDNGHYPCSLSNTGTIGNCAPDFTPTYMPVLPLDPSTGASYVYTSLQNDSVGDNLNCNNKTVIGYHLGAVTETTSSFLSQDRDQTLAQQTGYSCSASTMTTRFDGNAPACAATAASGVENCYDVGPDY